MRNPAPVILSIFLLLFSPLILAASGGSNTATDGPGYLPLKPAFVVNIRDGNKLRFLQVEVQLKLKDMQVSEELLQHESVIRHTMVMLLSNQEAYDLYSTTGKERLRKQALEQIRTALQDQVRQPPIDDLYFTNFIIQ